MLSPPARGKQSMRLADGKRLTVPVKSALVHPMNGAVLSTPPRPLDFNHAKVRCHPWTEQTKSDHHNRTATAQPLFAATSPAHYVSRSTMPHLAMSTLPVSHPWQDKPPLAYSSNRPTVSPVHICCTIPPSIATLPPPSAAPPHYSTDDTTVQVYRPWPVRKLNSNQHPVSNVSYSFPRRSRKKRPNKNKTKQSWLSFFCLDGEQHIRSLTTQLCTNLSNLSKNVRADLRNPQQIHLREGNDLTINYGDGYSDDWDLMQELKTSAASRKGPERNNATRLEIKFRDLFPCFAEIFDACGGVKNARPRRRGVQPNVHPELTTPKLETVCLDCGHILDQKALNKSAIGQTGHVANSQKWPSQMCPSHVEDIAGITGTQVSLNPLYDYGYGTHMRTWDEESTFSNYEGWKYADEGAADTRFHDGLLNAGSHNRNMFEDGLIPLPKFSVDQPRQFYSRPRRRGMTTRASRHSKYFDIDKAGRVALPHFPNDM